MAKSKKSIATPADAKVARLAAKGKPQRKVKGEALRQQGIKETTDRVEKHSEQGGVKPPTLLAAAFRVLTERGVPMTAGAIVKAAVDAKYWTPGDGKTPQQTLHAGMGLEIKHKGKESRFVKMGRGLFGCKEVA